MDIYRTWIYAEVLNAVWFLRMIVIAVLLGNVFMPVIIWYLVSGRPMFNRRRSKEQG